MKKVISFFLAFTFIFSMSATAFAAEGIPNADDTTFSYCNDAGEVVTVVTSRSNATAIAKVYVDGLLTQKSIASATTKTISTDIYDLTAFSKSPIQEPVGIMNGFKTYVTHVPTSTERITIADSITPARSVSDEPIDNTGLSASGYGDGYYTLGSYGGHPQAHGVYGYLYRKYTSTYDGETKYWSWGAGDSLAAISAYISLWGGPVSAIIGILMFTAGEILAYDQAINLATYTYNYDYRVRVNGKIYYTTTRNITYWRIDNVTEGTTKWERKSFNYGFSLSNTEMVLFGIDNYVAENQ